MLEVPVLSRPFPREINQRDNDALDQPGHFDQVIFGCIPPDQISAIKETGSAGTRLVLCSKDRTEKKDDRIGWFYIPFAMQLVFACVPEFMRHPAPESDRLP